jgi:hypothetical protein
MACKRKTVQALQNANRLPVRLVSGSRFYRVNSKAGLFILQVSLKNTNQVARSKIVHHFSKTCYCTSFQPGVSCILKFGGLSFRKTDCSYMTSFQNKIRPLSFLLCFFLSGLFLSCNEQTGIKAAPAPAASAPAAGAKPVVIEMISAPGTELSPKSIADICRLTGIATPQLYQWRNHTVLFDTLRDPEGITRQLSSALPRNARVKLYNNPFYEFNRGHCANESPAKEKEWDHILLTANLVADTALQREYLDYHATQFQKWPEVSKGFCNASFQQLLVFKNDRQLMLVISIPKGQSLDKLNPKTSENNPRVNDWNSLMKKYQEGIPGTGPGEVWVFLEKVH